MASFGSFALLLGLALSLYALVAGAVALRDQRDRLGETARRAGIAVFVAVTAAAVALVVSAFQNDFSLNYISATATATCPRLTSSRCSGRGRKARCCSGLGCSPDTRF